MSSQAEQPAGAVVGAFGLSGRTGLAKPPWPRRNKWTTKA